MKRSLHILACAVIAAIALATGSIVGAHPPPTADSQGRLTDSHGMALYTYDPDGTGNQSRCDGACAALWPPYLADSAARAPVAFSLVTRTDHGLQWSSGGRPLYRYAGDSKPGEASGDGMNGSWHVARMH